MNLDAETQRALLSSIRAKHTGWQIAFEGGVFVAVSRPAQTSQHIVVFPDLDDLDKRLTDIGEG
jgi:hypothetical protein